VIHELGEVVDAPLELLLTSSENPRVITQDRLAQLTRSLKSDAEMLRARPLIALPDGTVIAGNQRLLAARKLGWKTIPVVYVDLDPERARLWMLRDNQAFGDWDEIALAEMLSELAEAGADLDLTGFEKRELEHLLGELEREHNVDPQLAGMTYSLLIDCTSERQQGELAERLEREGYDVKLMIA
jgi:ParB-like chromosome segregation protein Spo0J